MGTMVFTALDVAIMREKEAKAALLGWHGAKRSQ
jgi:hypothetical protein